MVALKRKETAVEIDNPWADDKLGRKEIATYLTPIVTSVHQPFVISLNSPYGTGKTFFIKHWQKQLENEGFFSIYFNAWENDFDNEPLIPIISLIIDKIPTEKLEQSVKETLRGALGTAALIANHYLKEKTGFDAKEMGQQLEEDLEAKNLEKIGEKLYREYDFKKNAYKILKEKLSGYVETLDKKPLIVFVDELDRCRPDYAIRVLECIKHLFQIKSVVFVLAVDEQQLSSAIASVYGTKIDGEGYLRKFIDWRPRLPEPTYREYCENLFDQFALSETTKFTRDGNIYSGRDAFITIFSTFAKGFKLTPRQQEQCFIDINLVVRSLEKNPSPLAEILAGISCCKEKFPDEIANYCFGKKDPEDFLRILDEIFVPQTHLFDHLYGSWRAFRPYVHKWFVGSEIYQKLKNENTAKSDQFNQLNREKDGTTLKNDQVNKMQNELDNRLSYIREVIKICDERFRFIHLRNSVAETVYMRLERASFLSVHGLGFKDQET